MKVQRSGNKKKRGKTESESTFRGEFGYPRNVLHCLAFAWHGVAWLGLASLGLALLGLASGPLCASPGLSIHFLTFLPKGPQAWRYDSLSYLYAVQVWCYNSLPYL